MIIEIEILILNPVRFVEGESDFFGPAFEHGQ